MSHIRNRVAVLALAVSATFAMVGSASAVPVNTSPGRAGPGASHPRLLASGLGASTGSSIGPDGGIYVVDGAAGLVRRVDPRTGCTSTFATGLPKQVSSYGGPVDVAFVGRTAYVLVTLVSSDVGGESVDGIYRVNAHGRVTVFADIGAWSISHPPSTPFFVPSGVLYAVQTVRGGFLVTDGHHNRVLRVDHGGAISQVVSLGNTVPTGIAERNSAVYVGEAGPVPHLPEDGRILALRRGSHETTEIAAGAPLLVDVEFGPRNTLFALAQGHFTPGHDEGTPADPYTGQLLRVEPNGTMSPVASGLDRPTSLEIVGDNAYVVTLTGQLWQVNLRHLGAKPSA